MDRYTERPAFVSTVLYRFPCCLLDDWSLVVDRHTLHPIDDRSWRNSLDDHEKPIMNTDFIRSRPPHDMGGVRDFGPIKRDKNEDVFHELWESKVFAINLVLGPQRIHDPQGLRSSIENLDRETYLHASYYKRWLLAIEGALDRTGLVTQQELQAKTTFYRDSPEAQIPRREDPVLLKKLTTAMTTSRPPHHHKSETAPRFQAGDLIKVRTQTTAGHSRLPGYVRGKIGMVQRVHGIHKFQDFSPDGTSLGGPQPLYSVRFEALELWGPSAGTNESVYIDLWESYLQ